MKFNLQFKVQPVILRMLALASATLMLILAIGTIRAIARVDAPPGVPPSPATALTEWSFHPNQTESSSKTAVIPATSPQPVATSSPIAQPTPTVTAQTTKTTPTKRSGSGYEPPQEIAFADPTNYGDRYATDIYGNPVNNDWLIVLHETVGTADSAIQMFRTAHSNEDDQVSYHTLIRRNGTVVYVVPPEKRAFGAGNSVFEGPNGPETVKTDAKFPPSVNNFAYHISLESPPDGHNNNAAHSGYTQEQYQTLAWIIARTPVPNNRITTHAAIDQSGSRMDPRSFSPAQLLAELQTYPSRNSTTANQGG